MKPPSKAEHSAPRRGIWFLARLQQHWPDAGHRLFLRSKDRLLLGRVPRCVVSASGRGLYALYRSLLYLTWGTLYSDLDKTVVIFITQRDLEGKGKPVCWYQTAQKDDPEQIMPKATEFLFVNGKNPDRSTLLGRIIADIQEPDPNQIQTEALRRRMLTLKNSADGRKKMEDLLAAYTAERENQAKLGLLYQMVQGKRLALADAAEYAKMSPDAFGEAMRAHEASQQS